ncbi:MAG: hypothetical protein KDA83_03340 [Planctomycetales bacterium]|nr:hypothetical protein [Planctomycetales bacterium]
MFGSVSVARLNEESQRGIDTLAVTAAAAANQVRRPTRFADPLSVDGESTAGGSATWKDECWRRAVRGGKETESEGFIYSTEQEDNWAGVCSKPAP